MNYQAMVKAMAANHMVGRTIAEVRHMTRDEAAEMGWDARPPIVVFDDGNWIAPSMDDEGNDGGALYTSYAGLDVIGVVR